MHAKLKKNVLLTATIQAKKPGLESNYLNKAPSYVMHNLSGLIMLQQSAHSITINSRKFTLLIDHAAIITRIKEMANEITEKINLAETGFVVVMNGAFVFASHLLTLFHDPLFIVFVHIPTYSGMQKVAPPQEVSLSNYLPPGVIIIDDVLDTGETIWFLRQRLREQNVREVKTAVLFVKKKKRRYNIIPDYAGFVIPDKFIIGFGLDYMGVGRNLPHAYALDENPSCE